WGCGVGGGEEVGEGGVGRGGDPALAGRRGGGLRGRRAPLGDAAFALPLAPCTSRPGRRHDAGGLPARAPRRPRLPRERALLDLAVPDRAQRRPRRSAAGPAAAAAARGGAAGPR